MDESLSDFQEKKKTNAGPKKPKSKAKSTAKTLKRIRGQKDIRTAIKPKKNELLAYANDFDKICKQSGIDVDPEQLQVAIALSKSLQTQDCESQSSGSLNSQERTGRIRTTLLEYGFKVPEIKINATKKKRIRKQNYQLLLKTEAEKQQIICDKYAQVLLKQLDSSKIIDNSHKNDISTGTLYHIATHESYAILKSDSLFYIDNLIHQSQNTVGSLLRDWSEIPGRSATPTCDTIQVNFSEIECSEDELVTVLSGSITSAQYVAKCKHRLLDKNALNTTKKITDNILPENRVEHSLANITDILKTDSKMNINNEKSKIKEVTIIIEETSEKIFKNDCDDSIEIIDIDDEPKLQKLPLTVRSCSPDIFDDEVSSIMDYSKGNTGTISQDLPLCKTVTNNDVMDLTECVNVVSQKVLSLSKTINELPNSQLSQPNNVTKRKSNDFMEITNCVAGSSQPLIVNKVENNNVTQHSDSGGITLFENETEGQGEIVGNMDLTQTSNTDDELPFVQVSGKKYELLDDTIILNEDAYNCVHEERKTRSSEKDYSLDVIYVGNTDSKEQEINLEISTVSPEESITSIRSNPVPTESDEDCTLQEFTILNTSKKPIDTTPVKSKIPTKMEEFVSKSKTESFFEDFIHEHSSDGSKELKNTGNLEDSVNQIEIDNDQNDNDVDLTHSTDSERTINEIIETNSSQNKSVDNDENNIDLTQNSDSSERSLDDITEKTKSPQVSFGSLGKIGGRSIDYDEIFDDVVGSYASTSKHSENSNSVTFDGKNENSKNKNSDLISNCSQNSGVFEIIDQEFEYSLNKSRHDFPVENFDFGGISIMDDISKIRSSKSNANEEYITTHDLGKSMSDSLPMIYMKGTKYGPNNTDTKLQMNPSIALTPYRSNIKGGIAIHTPTNSEYIIKTDQVTPLIDYASLTTPERNNELNKFGLKPFKRKRAIQLLTHLYNQTHPTIESCSSEDLPSPSKKLKANNFYPNTSPKKQKSPMKRQASKSPVKNSQKRSPRKLKSPMKRQVSKSPVKNLRMTKEINIVETDDENNVYEITNETPDIRDIECPDEDWVFQKREKAKLHSCRVPLHIAFHNYVSTRLRLCEAILRYEPVNIDLIHKGLVASGHRYDPKDLLKFMDKKCITVKTVESNSRNSKKHGRNK